jgi:hypothetical protein
MWKFENLARRESLQINANVQKLARVRVGAENAMERALEPTLLQTARQLLAADGMEGETGAPFWRKLVPRRHPDE